MTKLTIDPISLEIMLNALRSVADETYNALTRSAYSTNIKERRDHSTAIMDSRGRLVAQADNSLPIHLSSMAGLMQALLRKYSLDEIHEGDIFISNDPHAAGGSHLPDINLAMPVFANGRLLAFVSNIAHHADVGGMAPGSVAGGMTEIYQEGLRIPAIKLFRRGRLVQDVFEILLLNVRLPGERRGDYNAQVAACRLGERRMQELVERHSADTLSIAFDEIILRTEDRLRRAVRDLPDGTYRFEDLMDDDGCENFDIRIVVAVQISGDRICFNFAGTASQAEGNINVPYNATHATLCYVLKALVDPDVPNNEGVLNVCELIAEPGSLVNCVAPAACASRANTCQRVVDVVIGALADALPQAVVAASNGANTAAVFFRSPSDFGCAICLHRDYWRRLWRTGQQGWYRWCPGSFHKYVQPADRSDGIRVSAAGQSIRARARFRRCRGAQGGVGHPAGCSAGRPCMYIQRPGRTDPSSSLGSVWRFAG